MTHTRNTTGVRTATRIPLTILAALVASAGSAAIIPVSPVGGEVVAFVPDAQKTVMAPPTLADRIALFREDREKGGKVIRNDKFWRKAKPVVLTWRVTEGEIGPWKVEVGTDPSLECADIRYVGTKNDTKNDTLKVDGDTVSFTMPRANLEIARGYYWRVTGRGKLAEGEKKRPVVRSEIASFATEDRAPRWIAINGNVANIRDLGGWRTADGCRVRQGMAFRGQGLNYNSVTGEAPGDNRLTVEDLKYMTRILGIRTDLDLRTKGETAGFDESPLGPGVRLILHSSRSYRGIFTDDGKKTMAENVRFFCDKANYPIYFHCISGADRTGSLAYVLLGTLGVPQHDIETEWESTFYPRIPDDTHEKEPDFWRRESHLTDGIAKYGDEGDSWQRRCELYLLDCGVTQEEIARLREILLEPQTTNH